MTTGSIFHHKRCHVGERRVERLSGQSFMLADQKKPASLGIAKGKLSDKKVAVGNLWFAGFNDRKHLIQQDPLWGLAFFAGRNIQGQIQRWVTDHQRLVRQGAGLGVA